jgi:thiosulfate/3-mercaptopyruvate sulfurtransferase
MTAPLPTPLPTPLISTAELAARLGEVLLIDASFDLANPAAGRAAFARAHLPGAVYAHLDEDLSSAKTGSNGRHPLPERALLTHKLGAWGVAPGRAVVVYDRNGGMYAARAWWLLRWLGHAAVTVLDGGLDAWQRAGGAVQAGEAVAPVLAGAAPYPAGESLVGSVDADTLARSLGQVCLVDARAPERYRGDVEPLDPVAGHIPGALNRLFKDNLAADGRFLPAEQLRAAWAPLIGATPAAEVIHQCGSGVTACHNILAMEVAGLGGSRLYPGSWSEWCADPARPVARG